VTDLERLAKIIAHWAESLPLKQVYIFGSRVRGDHKANSDLDVAVEYADFPTEQEMANWQCENDTDFAKLKSALGVTLSLHPEPNDAAWPAIRAGAKTPVLVIGKVCCVMTRATP
jgi:predicted nucleotidyltransferase